MKKHSLQLVLAGFFALSAGTVGAVLAMVALAPPAFAAACPTCDGNTGCVGSTCRCRFLGGQQFTCEAPGPIQP